MEGQPPCRPYFLGTRRSRSLQSDQFPNRFQIGVLLRDLAKRRIHFETGEQMDLGRFRIAEKRVVATHVVVINRLVQECDRPFQKKFLRLESFTELVQTETGMEKS